MALGILNCLLNVTQRINSHNIINKFTMDIKMKGEQLIKELEAFIITLLERAFRKVNGEHNVNRDLI